MIGEEKYSEVYPISRLQTWGGRDGTWILRPTCSPTAAIENDLKLWNYQPPLMFLPPPPPAPSVSSSPDSRKPLSPFTTPAPRLVKAADKGRKPIWPALNVWFPSSFWLSFYSTSITYVLENKYSCSFIHLYLCPLNTLPPSNFRFIRH